MSGKRQYWCSRVIGSETALRSLHRWLSEWGITGAKPDTQEC